METNREATERNVDTVAGAGTKDQAEGKVQHAWGEVKEGAENLLDKAKDALHKH